MKLITESGRVDLLQSKEIKFNGFEYNRLRNNSLNVTKIYQDPSILINGEINIFNGKAFAFMCVQNSTLIINFADLENTQKIFIDISDKSKILETLHIFLKAFPDKSK